MLAESISVARLVADALDALGVLYAIGGSLSSAVHGVKRATMNADPSRQPSGPGLVADGARNTSNPWDKL